MLILFLLTYEVSAGASPGSVYQGKAQHGQNGACSLLSGTSTPGRYSTIILFVLDVWSYDEKDEVREFMRVFIIATVYSQINQWFWTVEDKSGSAEACRSSMLQCD